MEENQDDRSDGLDISSSLTELKAESNEITNLSALIASLPNEVLSTIFRAGCLLPESKMKEPPFEILVSSVTRHWRNVAASTPNLWTQIIISDSTPSDQIVMYLTRSRSLPLDIWVDVTHDDRGFLSPTFFEQVVTPHIHRWRRLSIQCRHVCALFKLLRFVFAPQLEFLQVSRYDDGGFVYDAFFEKPKQDGSVDEIFTGGAPSLKSLRLHGIGLHCCVPPVSTLTTLHVHTPADAVWTRRNTFRDILDNLPVLTHLVIHGRVTDDDDSPTRPSLIPSLRSLCMLSSRLRRAQVSLLLIILAPCLESLVLEELSSYDIETLPHYPEWTTVVPRYPSLHSLTFTPYRNNLRFKTSTWNHVARFFPTIIEFTLLDIKTSAFINALKTGASSNRVSESSPIVHWWPNLQTLSLSDLNEGGLTPLLDVLSDRVIQGYPLRKLRLTKSDLLSAVKLLPQLREHVEMEEFKPKRWPLRSFHEWYDGE